MAFGLIIAIFLGLVFGSFGSVILSRRGDSESLEQASSILRGRSECPRCKKRLQPCDLIPVISFLLQKWKCRYCKKKISRLYPILELGSALIFWSVWYYLSDAGMGPVMFRTITGRMLWLLLIYDVLRYEVHLPLLIIISGVLILALWCWLFAWQALWGGISFLLIFLLLYRLAKRRVKAKYHNNGEGIGMGDVLMAPYLGTLLFAGIGNRGDVLQEVGIILIFFVLSGSIGIFRFILQNKIFRKKADFLSPKMTEQSVPFLPAMILAVVFILLFQNALSSLFSF